MIEEDQNLSMVSYSLGYADQSHFNKAFKKVLELSPNEYKQGVRSEDLPVTVAEDVRSKIDL